MNWNSQRAHKTVITIGLLLGWLDTTSGGVEASNSLATDIFIGVGSFIIYASFVACVWLRPTVGKFLALWAFLFALLLGVPLAIDFFLNTGGGAQAIQIARSMIMSSLFFLYTWTWKPKPRSLQQMLRQ